MQLNSIEAIKTAVSLGLGAAFVSLSAIEKEIPLIIWGENSAEEYGGQENLKGRYMSNKWRTYYGNSHNTSAIDWIDHNLKIKDLYPYNLPKQTEIKQKKIKEIFLGYYFKCDPDTTYAFSKKYGFKSAAKPKVGL